MQPPIRVADEMGEGRGEHPMRPIIFSCVATLPLAPVEISSQILDVKKWPDFHGYGPIPGIKAAEFEIRTGNIVGSRIRVTNLDGSTHVEEIVEWHPDQRLQLHMRDFSPPLSRLAAGFIETWEFEQVGGQTKITRSFEMNAGSMAAWPVLWLISFVLKRAIDRHLHQLGRQS